MKSPNLSDISKIYLHMRDDISRNIYSERLFYNMGGEGRESRIRRIMDIQGFSEPMTEFINSHVNQPKAIYGAGYWGQQVKKLFPEVRWECFIDNNAIKLKNVLGMECYKLEDFIRNFRNACFIVATNKFTKEIKEELIRANIKDDNIFCISDYMKHIEHDLQYFDLPALYHDEHETFVDIGALDGESTKQFIKWSKGNYAHAYIVEPNPYMQDIISKNMNGITHVSLITKAMSDECKEAMFLCGSAGCEGTSCIIDELNNNAPQRTVVPVTTLDLELAEKRITFIKIDVEGLEKKVLAGTGSIISAQKPKIAVCIYHRIEDMWEIPLILLKFRSDYDFYVRHYSWDSDETVLYAI